MNNLLFLFFKKMEVRENGMGEKKDENRNLLLRFVYRETRRDY